MLCCCLESHPFLHFCCVFRLVNVLLIIFIVLTSSGNPLLFFLSVSANMHNHTENRLFCLMRGCWSEDKGPVCSLQTG